MENRSPDLALPITPTSIETLIMTQKQTTANDRIPFTLISGFLGTGKTTLINKWLVDGFGDQQVAVIVNDFGKVSIDAALIATQSKNMLELQNGCVCCTLAGNLTRGILRLLEGKHFDRILMETSGVTQVAPLRRILESATLVNHVYLEHVVILTDAVRHPAISKVVLTINEQIQNASLVVINHCDQATEKQLAATKNTIEDVRPGAVISTCSFSQITFEKTVSLATQTPLPLTAGNQTKENWTTCRIIFLKSLTVEQLTVLMEKLPKSVLRAKGFAQSPEGFLEIQRVGVETTIKDSRQSISNKLTGSLVVIGSKTLTDDLENCLGDCPEVTIEKETVKVEHGG